MIIVLVLASTIADRDSDAAISNFLEKNYGENNALFVSCKLKVVFICKKHSKLVG